MKLFLRLDPPSFIVGLHPAESPLYSPIRYWEGLLLTSRIKYSEEDFLPWCLECTAAMPALSPKHQKILSGALASYKLGISYTYEEAIAKYLRKVPKYFVKYK